MGEILNTPQEKEESSCSIFCKGPNSAHSGKHKENNPHERRHNFCTAGALPATSTAATVSMHNAALQVPTKQSGLGEVTCSLMPRTD